MARTTPAVRDGYLVWSAEEGPERIAVGTPAWFDWLTQHSTFAYQTSHGSITVRRDRRQRGGWYWRAYHRRQGQLHRYYLGTTEALTPAHLASAAAALLDTTSPPFHSQAQNDVQPVPALPAAPLAVRPFLAARLRPPPPDQAILSRPAICERLATAVQRRLTVITAPPGFGKTTLLSQWAQFARERGQPIAWLSIERDDNDAVRFWSALLAALQTAYPGFAILTAARLAEVPAQPIEPFLVELLNALGSIPHDLTIVLDDYHLIDAPELHSTIASFIERLPHQIHLLVSSRTAPPWPRSRLRAAGELSELGVADLCLSPAEIAAFLRMQQLDLSVEQVATLSRLTEGWAAGVRLAAEALRRHPAPNFDARSLDAGHKHLFAFFAEEVLQGLTATTQAFLRDTAMLDRLNGSLCVAVTADPASEAVLVALACDQFFLTPLDPEQRWYRYHTLFAAFLRERVIEQDAARRALLYHRAVSWFSVAKLYHEAISHALAGGLNDEAAALIEEHGAHWLLQGELRTLCGWLDALPTTVLLSRPRLRLLNLSALMLDARWDCVEPLLRDMTALSMLDQQSEAAILQALGALMAGHLATAEATLAVARRLAHDDDGFIQTMLILLDGAIAWVGGAQERAQTVLATLTIPGLAGSGRQIALLAIAHQAHFDAVAGRLEPAILRYRQVCAQAKADRSEGTLALGMAALGLAQLHYERNELDAAVEAAGQAMAEAQRWGQQGLAASATLVQAQSLLAQGELSTATSLVHRLELAVRRVPLQQVDMICLALARAELALAQEETMIAASWLASLTAELYQLPPGQLRERVQRAQARVLLGRGDADAAAALLAPLLQAADERGRINSLVPLLALAAIAAEALGQQREALILLERAVGLGAGGPYVQSMLEGGPSLFGLLDKLQAVDAGVVRYIQLLRTTADARQRQRDRVLVGELESLSLRERAVLRLIASGATNREIALQLALAESTVKKYLASIYQKLGVVRRTQALAEARARDLL